MEYNKNNGLPKAYEGVGGSQGGYLISSNLGQYARHRISYKINSDYRSGCGC